MTGECIRDGDYILVESRNDAENGELVIIRTEGDNVILRKVFRQNNYTMLQHTSPGTNPVIVNEKDLEIHGVILGVFRDYTE